MKSTFSFIWKTTKSCSLSWKLLPLRPYNPSRSVCICRFCIHDASNYFFISSTVIPKHLHNEIQIHYFIKFFYLFLILKHYPIFFFKIKYGSRSCLCTMGAKGSYWHLVGGVKFHFGRVKGGFRSICSIQRENGV